LLIQHLDARLRGHDDEEGVRGDDSKKLITLSQQHPNITLKIINRDIIFYQQS
jgi:hypothetical protein